MNIWINLYIVSLVYLITAIILNKNQYENNPYYYQNKNKENINPVRDVITYKPTLLDSFFSTMGINGYYVNGVTTQTIYIIFTSLLYFVVEYTFGSFISIIIFILIVISNFYYPNRYNSLCNDTTLYSSIPTFCCGSNLMVSLLAMVEFIIYTKIKSNLLKLFIVFGIILTYIGTCIYDYKTLNQNVLNSMSFNNKLCKVTMWHGFYFIEGFILFILFYNLKKLFR